jgi:hypothetical protein
MLNKFSKISCKKKYLFIIFAGNEREFNFLVSKEKYVGLFLLIVKLKKIGALKILKL